MICAPGDGMTMGPAAAAAGAAVEVIKVVEAMGPPTKLATPTPTGVPSTSDGDPPTIRGDGAAIPKPIPKLITPSCGCALFIFMFRNEDGEKPGEPAGMIRLETRA